MRDTACSQFREKRKRKWELLSLSSFHLFFFFNQPVGRHRRVLARFIAIRGVQLQNLRIEPLSYLSTMCVKNAQKTYNYKRIWSGSYWSLLPNCRKSMFESNRKRSFFFYPPSDNKDKWMDCFSDTNGQIWERKRPCVVTVGPIMWRPLGRPVGSGRAGWLVVIARSRLIGQWSTHTATPLCGEANL